MEGADWMCFSEMQGQIPQTLLVVARYLVNLSVDPN